MNTLHPALPRRALALLPLMMACLAISACHDATRDIQSAAVANFAQGDIAYAADLDAADRAAYVHTLQVSTGETGSFQRLDRPIEVADAWCGRETVTCRGLACSVTVNVCD